MAFLNEQAIDAIIEDLRTGMDGQGAGNEAAGIIRAGSQRLVVKEKNRCYTNTQQTI